VGWPLSSVQVTGGSEAREPRNDKTNLGEEKIALVTKSANSFGRKEEISLVAKR
jgi:hypothetical protein